MFYAIKEWNFFLLKIETNINVIGIMYKIFIEKVYANQVIFLKRLLLNYSQLCDFNGFGFIPGKNTLKKVLVND